jgi:hypothetical protein
MESVARFPGLSRNEVETAGGNATATVRRRYATRCPATLLYGITRSGHSTISHWELVLAWPGVLMFLTRYALRCPRVEARSYRQFSRRDDACNPATSLQRRTNRASRRYRSAAGDAKRFADCQTSYSTVLLFRAGHVFDKPFPYYRRSDRISSLSLSMSDWSSGSDDESGRGFTALLLALVSGSTVLTAAFWQLTRSLLNCLPPRNSKRKLQHPAGKRHRGVRIAPGRVRSHAAHGGHRGATGL